MRCSSMWGVSALSSLLWVAHATAAPQPEALPQTNKPLKQLAYAGCYSSSETLEDQGPYTFQTSGHCQQKCVNIDKPVMGLKDGSNCWCGSLLPPETSKVEDGKCDIPCFGFDKDTCGGDKTWQVYLTGVKPRVDRAEPSSSSNSASATQAAAAKITSAAVVTVQGQTQTVTAATSTPTAGSNSSNGGGSSGASKAGVAAGIAGGLAACALAVGAFFFIRMKRRRAAREEAERLAEIEKFVGKKPSSASSLSDSRLEPSVVLHRRESDGSIADNQDYSRRILKVTNPDGR